MAVSDDWIKSRAYELWENEGRPHGKDAEHWEQARQEYAAQDKKSLKRKTAIAPEPAPTDPVIDTAPAKPAPKAAAKPKPAPAVASKKKPVKKGPSN